MEKLLLSRNKKFGSNMAQKIETYVMLLKHEMFAENIKAIDKDFIEQIVLRAGGKSSEVGEVLNHPAVIMADNGEYILSTDYL